jgi:hypothetical protein
LRTLLVEHPATDIKLTHDVVMTAASRYEALPGVSYLDFVKQLLPTWLLTQGSLTWEERNLVKHGISFRQHFLRDDAQFHLPRREHLQGEHPEVLARLRSLLMQVIQLREVAKQPWEEFDEPVHRLIADLGPQKKAILHRLRLLVGQQHGLPVARILFFLPLDYLHTIEYTLELYCASVANHGVAAAPVACDCTHSHLQHSVPAAA